MLDRNKLNNTYLITCNYNISIAKNTEKNTSIFTQESQ